MNSLPAIALLMLTSFFLVQGPFPVNFHPNSRGSLVPSTRGLDGSESIQSQSHQLHQGTNEWCTQVQDDLLAKVLNTVHQLTVKLNADVDPPELVIQTCKAIQACLDTLHTLKRTWACSSPQLDATGLPPNLPIDSPSS